MSLKNIVNGIKHKAKIAAFTGPNLKQRGFKGQEGPSTPLIEYKTHTINYIVVLFNNTK